MVAIIMGTKENNLFHNFMINVIPKYLGNDTTLSIIDSHLHPAPSTSSQFYKELWESTVNIVSFFLFLSLIFFLNEFN